MNKKIIGVILFILVALLLTNPNMEDFVQYVENESISDATNTETEIDDLLAHFSSEFISSFTTRKDYKIFSQYEIGDKTYIGFAKYFFVEIS